MPALSAAPVNSTTLRAEPLESPPSRVSVQFAAPELGEHVLLADPLEYRVRVTLDAVGPEVTEVQISLDAGRPRRLSLLAPTIRLGELLSEDAKLAQGSHWLFAAPVLASGLVPKPGSAGARAARARRFFVGNLPNEAEGPSGAVWLRKPDGTYNGQKAAESILFEAFVFSAMGLPIDAPITITLRAPAVSGQLSLASPFVLHEVPSGAYEASVSALAAPSSTTYFTVNRELAGGS